jgi:hypothetical protein
MKYPRLCVPLGLLLAAVLACSPSSVLPNSTALYKDNFSDSSSGWCVSSSSSSSTDYGDGDYVMTVTPDNWFVWCNSGHSFGDIHLEVTARDVSAKGDTVFGVLCNEQKAAVQSDEDYYILGLSSDGHYSIRLSQGGKDTVLAEDRSAAIPTQAVSYTVGADCAGGNLALYVNGKQIASAHDTTYTSGDVGLFAWTGDGAPAEIHYDDLVVTKLSTATATPK